MSTSSRIRTGLFLAFALLVTLGVATKRAPADQTPDWAPPTIERSISIRDGRTGATVDYETMLADLATVDAVFLGETHVDETTHRFELAVYEQMLQRRGGRVVLAMEMFERDVQSVLDDYLAGRIDEATFLKGSRPWGNYHSGYRPLIERARTGGHQVIASNFPRPLTRRVAREGLGILETLPEVERNQVPAELFPNSPEYWQRVDNAVRGHLAMMRRNDNDDERLSSTQTLWDNAMGEACAIALEANPGSQVLHVNGGFHSAYRDGTVRQLLLRRPNATVRTVDIRSTTNPQVADTGGRPVADYVVFAESRATDKNEGSWSVALSRTLDYRMYVPKSATPEAPAPLLIWLGNDGLTAQDGLDLCRDLLGDDVAIVSIDPPYRGLQVDLSPGGRWFWPDSFFGDVGSMVGAVDRVWGYVMRHTAVDPDRVVIAGEGAGATVVSAIALLGDRMRGAAIAIAPSKYSKLKDIPLPLPEYRDPGSDPTVSLAVIGTDGDSEWWHEELNAYRGVGMTVAFTPWASDAGQRSRQSEETLRRALGMDSRDLPNGAPAHLGLPADTPRARHWARRYALRHTAATGQPVVIDATGTETDGTSIAPTMHPSQISDSLPPCEGPFGGTTVLVLPDSLPAADVQAWLDLEENDPLTRRNRFLRLRIVTGTGDRTLGGMLEKLEGEGRHNVLIVPAVFCADGQTMRELERQARPLADRMTQQWLPGLGGGDLPVADDAVVAQIGTVRHDLDVVIDPVQHSIVVHDIITLPPSVRHAGAEFTLNRELEITEASPKVRQSGHTENGDRRYALTEASSDGVLTLRYAGAFTYGLGDQKEEYARGFRDTRGLVGPEGIFLNGGSAWVAQFEDEMIRFDLKVKAPEDWHVISQGNGTSQDEPGRAIWTSGGELEQVYLVGGPLQVDQDMAGAIEVLVYLHEMDDALSRKYLDATAAYIEMYRKLIGPYPYKKFALVENFWETGYGMPSFTLLGPQVIRFPFILHSSYPHEILHNWWGNSVFVAYETGNWCEGLTAYMADHLIQEQRGAAENYRRGTLQKYRDYVKEGRDFPLTQFINRHSAATEAVGYGKSLMTFHMLRRQVGEDIFRSSMASFYRKYRGTRASWADIRTVFESETGQDLASFFSQWVERTGAPKLALEDVSVQTSGDGFQVRGRLVQQQAGDAYQLQVPVLIATDTGTTVFTLEMSGTELPFLLDVASEPGEIVVDPQFDLFRQLDPRETPNSIGQIFGEPTILAILPSAADAATQASYRELMDAWSTPDHVIEVVLDRDVEALPADRGVWVLGYQNSFAEKLVPEIRDGATRLDGETVAGANHSVVVIHRHPGNVEKAVGFLAADPPEAFAGMARKLPHYGKYSYLAFEGAEPSNTIKGQWTTIDSPLVIDLAGAAEVALEPRSALAELPPTFSKSTLMGHVEWLADPARKGRGLGTPELDASARYIAVAFDAAGLEPGGDNGTWFQTFTVEEGPDGTPVTAQNVIGVLRGHRADWSEQSFVLGAHFDHLGLGWPDVHAGSEGKIHPGADDNASGVAVLIEVARNFVQSGGGSRNLVVVAFSAEEAGRWGSQHYVANPLFPASGINGVINMDSVGRLGDAPLAIHGTGTTTEWQHIFRGCGFVTGVPSRNVPGAADGSDQASFIAAGIPGVQIFTGAHSDYHRPGDTIDKVDAPGLVKVATFVKEAVTYMLEREEPMTITISGHAATPPTRSASGGRRVTFGTVPSFEFQGKGVLVDDVVEDSPAAAAGVLAGDVVIELNGEEIADLRAFSNALKTFTPGDTVTATLLRDGKRVTVKVVVTER